jgi:small GTP-binding protein
MGFAQTILHLSVMTISFLTASIISAMSGSDPRSSKVKVVFIGNSSVGKTSLFTRFQNRGFSQTLPSTIGGACANVDVELDDSTPVHLIVWDTAGQDTYRGIVPMYFTRCSYILLVYDISSRQSFDSVSQWITLSKEKAPEDVKIILIGNKSDMEGNRSVTATEGGELANSSGAFLFFETSALNGDGVEALLMSLATDVAKNPESGRNKISPTEVAIERPSSQSDHKGCC